MVYRPFGNDAVASAQPVSSTLEQAQQLLFQVDESVQSLSLLSHDLEQSIGLSDLLNVNVEGYRIMYSDAFEQANEILETSKQLAYFTESLADFSLGDYLLDSQTGLLRRVVSSEVQQGITYINTEFSEPLDAFGILDISYDGQTLSLFENTSWNESFTFVDIFLPLFSATDSQNKENSLKAGASFRGNISFSLEMATCSKAFLPFVEVETFESVCATVLLDLEHEASLTGHLEKEYNIEPEEFQIANPRFTVLVYGVPVTLSCPIRAGYSFSVSGQADLVAGYNVHPYALASVRYHPDEGWSHTMEWDCPREWIGPRYALQGDLHFKPYVSIGAKLSVLHGLVSIEVGAQPNLVLEATGSVKNPYGNVFNPDIFATVDLSVGIDAYVGAGFGWFLEETFPIALPPLAKISLELGWPAYPQDIGLSEPKGRQGSIAWKDCSDIESGYELELVNPLDNSTQTASFPANSVSDSSELFSRMQPGKQYLLRARSFFDWKGIDFTAHSAWQEVPLTRGEEDDGDDGEGEDEQGEEPSPNEGPAVMVDAEILGSQGWSIPCGGSTISLLQNKLTAFLQFLAQKSLLPLDGTSFHVYLIHSEKNVYEVLFQDLAQPGASGDFFTLPEEQYNLSEGETRLVIGQALDKSNQSEPETGVVKRFQGLVHAFGVDSERFNQSIGNVSALVNDQLLACDFYASYVSGAKELFPGWEPCASTEFLVASAVFTSFFQVTNELGQFIDLVEEFTSGQSTDPEESNTGIPQTPTPPSEEIPRYTVNVVMLTPLAAVYFGGSKPTLMTLEGPENFQYDAGSQMGATPIHGAFYGVPAGEYVVRLSWGGTIVRQDTIHVHRNQEFILMP